MLVSALFSLHLLQCLYFSLATSFHFHSVREVSKWTFIIFISVILLFLCLTFPSKKGQPSSLSNLLSFNRSLFQPCSLPYFPVYTSFAENFKLGSLMQGKEGRGKLFVNCFWWAKQLFALFIPFNFFRFCDAFFFPYLHPGQRCALVYILKRFFSWIAIKV